MDRDFAILAGFLFSIVWLTGYIVKPARIVKYTGSSDGQSSLESSTGQNATRLSSSNGKIVKLSKTV